MVDIRDFANAISVYGEQRWYAEVSRKIKLSSQSSFSDFPGDFADDAAAALGGIPVGGIYRTSNALKVRVT